MQHQSRWPLLDHPLRRSALVGSRENGPDTAGGLGVGDEVGAHLLRYKFVAPSVVKSITHH